MLEKNKIHCMDCLKGMKQIEDNSVDTIITDPPYGLSFMKNQWDYDVPSVDIWKECLRILKPGGTALIFAGSRTQHRMAVNVEDAGFILKDCIMWLYGSGFPKATDISKQLDKGHKREVIGSSRAGSKARNGHKGDMAIMPFKTKTIDLEITAPTTPEAKLWDGWKSHGLKPAYEPILVAMKPNDGSYAQNALKHNVSGLNIEGGKVSSQFGRFPANIILDEESAKMLNQQNISSSASRFFYCAKASKKERGEYNNHPTVKPIRLMEYLCILTKTPQGGIVFDPYAGSGTTLMAANNVGRLFIGFEKEKKYYEIAKQRIKEATKQKTLHICKF